MDCPVLILKNVFKLMILIRIKLLSFLGQRYTLECFIPV